MGEAPFFSSSSDNNNFKLTQTFLSVVFTDFTRTSTTFSTFFLIASVTHIAHRSQDIPETSNSRSWMISSFSSIISYYCKLLYSQTEKKKITIRTNALFSTRGVARRRALSLVFVSRYIDICNKYAFLLRSFGGAQNRQTFSLFC